MTLLCVPIMVQAIESALADAQAAKDAGADLVEFRIDEIFSGDATASSASDRAPISTDSDETRTILRLVAESTLPCIVTCRHASEGGAYDGDEDARVSLYERLGTAAPTSSRDDPAAAKFHPPRFLDFELDAYTRSANIRQKIDLAVDQAGERLGSRREHAPSLILSNHDFDSRPADLSRRVLRMREQPAAKVCKFAFRARSLRDNLEIFDLLAERDRPTIALGMGEFGLMSRVLAPKFGGFLTFASLRPASVTAPGQPTVRELLDLYRFRSIDHGTRVFGVIGWPVGHSLSPLVHNAGFDSVGFNGVYLPLPVAAGENAPDGAYENFKATLLAMLDHPRLDFSGASVTIPHKENLVRLAREQRWGLDALSDACGAANTIVVEDAPVSAGAASSASPRGPGVLESRRIRVINSDAPAALSCLREAIGPLDEVAVGVIGAGGVARAITLALAHAGADVVIYNRDLARARLLADAVRAAVPSAKVVPMELSSAEKSCCRAWVNCTPVGMKGGPDPGGFPIDPLKIRNCDPGTAVLDTVYNPVRTPLLARAAEARWRTIDGVSMFVRQAATQFEAWTHRPAPVGLFEQRVRDALG